MAEEHLAVPELPNFINILAERFHSLGCLKGLDTAIFSLIVIFIISIVCYLASRSICAIPGRLQAACELFVGGADDFICGMLGPKGRRFTPFIGTLFIYILFMNLAGLVPFAKSSTSSWSTTMALAICVFFYLQYTAFRELGFLGYVDHLLGRPRGIVAMSVVVPLMMLVLHITSEFVRPVSLSLRLRSNIWGDDMLLAVLAGFGIKGAPLLLFNMFSTILVSIVQAGVFCLLTTIYFTLVLTHEE